MKKANWIIILILGLFILSRTNHQFSTNAQTVIPSQSANLSPSPTSTLMIGNGDVDNNGLINGDDLLLLAKYYMNKVSFPFDQYGDGLVNLLDFSVVVNAMTTPTPLPTSTPLLTPTFSMFPTLTPTLTPTPVSITNVILPSPTLKPTRQIKPTIPPKPTKIVRNTNLSPNTPINNCNDIPPGSIPPYIFQATAIYATSVTLSFYPGEGTIDNYQLEYGTTVNTYTHFIYNAIISLNNNAYNTTVMRLKKDTQYYFRIRGIHGCAVGSWSNEISAATSSSTSFKIPFFR